MSSELQGQHNWRIISRLHQSNCAPTEFSKAKDTASPGLMPASLNRPAVSHTALCRAARDTAGEEALQSTSAGP
eukprot:1149325-Pelagomonas_calceolata.AAC.7